MSEKLIQLLVESFPKILLPGLKLTIPLTAGSFAIALVIAVICALIQVAKVPVLRQLVKFYVWVIRGTPLLVQLLAVFYGLPSLGVVIKPIPCAILVFSINEGAYCAETMRAAIESVPRGQMEAGVCVGMNWMQTMWHVVLPQAFRTAFPPLSNSLISLLKDTSLASNITVMEMFAVGKRIAGQRYETLALYLEVALIYLIFCTVLTTLQGICEKKLSTYGF